MFYDYVINASWIAMFSRVSISSQFSENYGMPLI